MIHNLSSLSSDRDNAQANRDAVERQPASILAIQSLGRFISETTSQTLAEATHVEEDADRTLEEVRNITRSV